MSLFDLQDVRIAIGSIATLDLQMVADLIGIFVLKRPYYTIHDRLILAGLSVIPRGSWGDVARRFTMIRWAVDRSDLIGDRSYDEVMVMGMNRMFIRWTRARWAGPSPSLSLLKATGGPTLARDCTRMAAKIATCWPAASLPLCALVARHWGQHARCYVPPLARGDHLGRARWRMKIGSCAVRLPHDGARRSAARSLDVMHWLRYTAVDDDRWARDVARGRVTSCCAWPGDVARDWVTSCWHKFLRNCYGVLWIS
ncbi:hypothetical protein F511_28891 [Dorcoceras hygrometricum]|uniref:Uncharacterized protein n=1 Tax=Dorcoceras hygrometricum TaxID=472368 RepID=A0A2Z7CMW0_9LAMI|nr:hypothetical protein F511_28891 [Dorcoceras hygrometricum]